MHNIYVISSNRDRDLGFSNKQKKDFLFCVGNGQKKSYEKAGCKTVFETGSLIDSRNFALDHAFELGVICVQVSDDLKRVVLNKNFYECRKEVDLTVCINDMVKKFIKTEGVYLLGTPPTDNHFFSAKIVSKNTFCIGDMFMCKPNPIRFDNKLTLKEDYDFTLQHIKKFGTCIRYQKYIFSFEHYKNSGGAVEYRDSIEEGKNIRYLIAKWGDKIKLNPKRNLEILI